MAIFVVDLKRFHPNYKLEKCHRENEAFQKVEPVTFRNSFKTLSLRLWDEEAGKLVTFKQALAE